MAFPRPGVRVLQGCVEADGPLPSKCWIFTGTINSSGYGHVMAPSRFTGKRVTRISHRVLWEELFGPVPEGLDLDHLCRNRACQNPMHLEPVTRRENLLRGETIVARNAQKTHCKRGHEFTTENTIQIPRGRACRECRRAYDRKRGPARRAAERLARSNQGDHSVVC